MAAKHNTTSSNYNDRALGQNQRTLDFSCDNFEANLLKSYVVFLFFTEKNISYLKHLFLW